MARTARPASVAATAPPAAPASIGALPLTAAHRRRLREVWRSAGWPYQDLIEAELLAAGLLERQPPGHNALDTVRVTDAGVAAIAATGAANRARLGAHEALVAKVVRAAQHGGRLVWRGLRLRAGLLGSDTAERAPAVAEPLPIDIPEGARAGGAYPPLRWCTVIPDVFSIRRTSVEAYLEPEVHEVKVHRSDLLADLRRPDKGAAYRALSRRCWYVLREGIGGVDDVPPEYGVMVEAGAVLEVLRPAPSRHWAPTFDTWMALAQATPEPWFDDDAQAALGAATAPVSPAGGGA